MHKATFALGCFWGPDEFFSHLKGVEKTTVGYIGGKEPNPTYERVCGGDSGHTEAIEIIFNEDIITYEQLLTHFFAQHDSARESKAQYKSAIYFHSDKQKHLAQKEKAKHNDSQTQILKAPTFYPAEDYHQKYFQKHKILKKFFH